MLWGCRFEPLLLHLTLISLGAQTNLAASTIAYAALRLPLEISLSGVLVYRFLSLSLAAHPLGLALRLAPALSFGAFALAVASGTSMAARRRRAIVAASAERFRSDKKDVSLRHDDYLIEAYQA